MIETRISFLPGTFAAAVGVAVALVLAVSGSSAAESSNLEIGYLTPLTGPSSSTGHDSKDGAQLAVDIANESNFLPGVKIKLLTEDDKSAPEIAVVAVQKLQSEGAQVITGTINSSVAVAVANVLADDPNSLYIISGAQIQTPLDQQTGDNIFGLTHTNAQFDAASLKWIKDNVKPKRVAFLGENTDFGVQELKQLRANWNSGSPEIVLNETFERSDTDYSTILSKVRQSDADSIYVGAGSSAITAAIFRQADQLGLKVNKFMSSGLFSNSFVEAGGPAVNGVTAGDVYNAAIDNPENAKFLSAFRKAYGKDPNSLNELGYDSVNLVLQSMKKAGTVTDIGKVASTLRNGVWSTPRGQLAWDKTGRAQSDVLIVGVRDGKLTLLATEPASGTVSR